MSKRLNIILVLVVILIVDISYTATVYNLDKFLRFGVFTYIEDKTCGAIGGRMIEYYHGCTSERRCIKPFKDANKECDDSEDCQGKCLIKDSDIRSDCRDPNDPHLAYGGYCPGLVGRCQEYYDQINNDYINGRLEFDFSSACGL